MTSILRSISIVTMLCLLGLTTTHAQISIGQNDIPVSSDTLRYSEASFAGPQLDLTTTGPNSTWDFSSLTPAQQGIAQYKTAAQVSIAYGFAFGLTAYGLKVADTAGAGPVTVTNLYDFYKRNATGFSTIGRGFTYQGFPVPATYSDPDEIYQFPLNFSDRDSSTFHVKFSLATLGSLVQDGYRINTVDGWGSITTPYGTFNALRVRTKMVETDSLQSPQLPFPVAFTTTTITYSWLAAGQHYPILQVTAQEDFGFETVTGITYRDIKRVIVPAPPLPDFFAFQTNISAGDSVLILNTTRSVGAGTTFLWSLDPPAGWHYAVGSSASSNSPMIAFTSPGSYTVNLTATNAGGTADTTKPDYIVVDPVSIAKPLAAIGGGIYPNPTTGKAALTLPMGAWQGRMLDASGRQVQAWPRLEGGKTQLNLNALPAGMYILEIVGKKGRFAERVAVSK